MQFTKENAEKVMAKSKTQTRRIIKTGDSAFYFFGSDGIITKVEQNGRLKWHVNHIYSVQPGRGKSAIGHVRLLKIRKEKLQDISHQDALAELGIIGDCDNAIDEFAELWDSINPKGHKFIDNDGVWVLTFEVVQ